MSKRAKLVGVGIAASVAGMVGLAITPSQPAGAIDSADVLLASWGTFSHPLRPDGTANVLCVLYGTSPSNDLGGIGAAWGTTSDLTTQTQTPRVLNQIRFGAEPVANNCVNPPYPVRGFGASGLGYIGTKAAAGSPLPSVGDYLEAGRFYHFNRTIEQGAATVDFALSTSLTDPITGAASKITDTYTVQVIETPDYAGVEDTSLCTVFPDAGDKNYTVPADATLGTPAATLCADSVSFVPPSTAAANQVGETTLNVEVAGTANVVDGVCDPATVTDGGAFFTSEQAINEVCVLMRVVPGTVTINKTVTGDPIADATYSFTVTEFDQVAEALDPTVTTAVDVVTTSGAGSTSPIALAPGLWAIDEITDALPDGMTPGDLVCQTDGNQATVAINGTEYVDLDSGENITCWMTNDFVAATTTTTTTTSTSTTLLPTTTTTETVPPSTITTTTAGPTTTTTTSVAVTSTTTPSTTSTTTGPDVLPAVPTTERRPSTVTPVTGSGPPRYALPLAIAAVGIGLVLVGIAGRRPEPG